MAKLPQIKSLFANLNQIDELSHGVSAIRKELENERILLGKLFTNRIKETSTLESLHDAEFKVFSQWGDDGIIQYLVNQLDITARRFIEFGVENYIEANTRFLLLNDNWSGLVMDCSEENVAYIKSDDIYWKHDLTAISTFVTAENINDTLAQAGFAGEVGLLHIDVDGNDYWIWKAIDVVSPVIAIIEYNSLFGRDRAITVPYDPKFDRFAAHHSGIYAGASLAALCDLAGAKGYVLVGSNSAGNNAYFVRKDRLGGLKELRADQGYVACKFREHRNESGQLTFLPGQEAIKRVRGMRVFNTRTNEIEEL
jgi:hypothetical protein